MVLPIHFAVDLFIAILLCEGWFDGLTKATFEAGARAGL
jgi:hypothetical protein